MKTLPVLLAGVLFLLLVQCLFGPQDETTRGGVADIPPVVRITAGACAGDSCLIDYRVGFYWVGSDPDGVIETYQYAVDDTLGGVAWLVTGRDL